MNIHEAEKAISNFIDRSQKENLARMKIISRRLLSLEIERERIFLVAESGTRALMDGKNIQQYKLPCD